jgi:hypothetical protein
MDERADERARRAVQVAVLAGHLPPVKARRCADCEGPAAVYHHHSGYAPEHWLSVEPLCRKCHHRRHPARRAPRREEVPLPIRVTPETYEGLKAAATEEGRSLNKQLERVLEAWLRERERGAQPYPFRTTPTTRVAENEGPPYRPHGAPD